MKQKWKIYWPYYVLLLFVLAGIVGWFVLPAELVIRSGSTMPKLIGLLGPVAMAALGGSLTAREKTRWAGAVVLVLAAVLEIMLFAWNF